MHWIIQNNLFNEAAYPDIIATFEHGQIPYTEVKVIPFSHELDPIPDVANPIAVLGSTTLVRIAKSYGWGPGVFWDDDLNFEVWRDHWGSELLNYSAKVQRFEDVEFSGKRFIRPVDDLKMFAGEVVKSHSFSEWQQKIVQYDDGMITKDTLVVVAPVWRIYVEYRFFVINGKVITGSLYKCGNKIKSDSFIPTYAWTYAQNMIEKWSPDIGFVLDIAETECGFKIIEVNNLNSSGFYACDVSKIIQAIDALT